VSRHASKMKYTSDLSILTKTINTTSATSGAGTAHPSGALEFTQFHLFDCEHIAMFGSSLPSVVCGRAHILFVGGLISCL
jgi:hypothetical protein